MFLFLFYAAKVRRKFEPRKKLFHPVTTLFHYATPLSTKHHTLWQTYHSLLFTLYGRLANRPHKTQKKRPPEGNLFLILQYTTHFGKLSDSTTHFGKLSEFDKVFLPLNPKFSHLSHKSYPSQKSHKTYPSHT